MAADKDQFISPTALPAWIEIESDKELSGEVIEYLAKRAAYVGSFHGAGNENRLNWLIDAHCALGAGSIGEWNDLLDKFYPPHPLILGETPHSHTSDAKVKAHFLGFALSRLLKLVGASPTVANDVQILLSGYPVTERKAYSRVQRELLTNKTSSYRAIEERTGVDQSEISQSIKAGQLLDPWREGRP